MNDLAVKEKNEIAMHQPGQSSSLMNLVERLATDKEIDPARVDHAFEMYMKVRAVEAEAAFSRSMALAQSEIQNIVVNKKNNQTNSKYADLAAIHEGAKSVWTKYGFSVVTRTTRSDLLDHIRVICDVRHDSGHKETHEDDWPIDGAGLRGNANKTAIQAKGSTVSYARRYVELMIFDVATFDDNDGNGTPKAGVRSGSTASQSLNKQQLETLRKAMKSANISDSEVCKFAQIDRIDDLPQARLQGTLKRIEKFTASKGGAK